LNRALDKKLYLIVKSKDGQWHFPHLEHQAGETMRQVGAEFGPENNAA
jgi:hypothetical protein